MIDQQARNQLIQKNVNVALSQGLSQMSENLRAAMDKKDPLPVLEIMMKQLIEIDKKLNQDTQTELKNIQAMLQKNGTESADFQKLDSDQYQKLVSFVEDIQSRISAFEDIKQRIDKGQAVLFPKVDIGKIEQPLEVTVLNPQKVNIPTEVGVHGKVDVGSIQTLPPVEVSNLAELSSSMQGLFTNLQNSLANLILALPKPDSTTKKTGPVEVKEWNNLLQSIEDLKGELVTGFNLLIKNSQESKGMDSSTPMLVEIVKDLPRPTPNPVTNVSLNGLGGVPLSTATTVTTTATPLPTTSLANRRGVVVFNNDSSTTLYIGGSGVTTSNGMPVPALAYSPALDIGVKFIIYGIVATGSINVRVLELSDVNTNVGSFNVGAGR